MNKVKRFLGPLLEKEFNFLNVMGAALFAAAVALIGTRAIPLIPEAAIYSTRLKLLVVLSIIAVMGMVLMGLSEKKSDKGA